MKARRHNDVARVPSGAAIEMDGVIVAYGDHDALGPVDLRVGDGERLALVGPSGAGKSSLLRVLAGQVRPSGGRVEVAGAGVETFAAGDLPRVVGILSQRLDLVPQLSAERNIAAGALGRMGVLRSLAMLLLPLRDPAVPAAAARLGIADVLGRRVSQLSGGEQQRVAFARLLVQDPLIVLVDEPVASLDPARADDLLAFLAYLAGEHGKTLIASLHDPQFARRHFDRVIGLRAGRIAFDRPAAQVSDADLEQVYRLPALQAPADAAAT